MAISNMSDRNRHVAIGLGILIVIGTVLFVRNLRAYSQIGPNPEVTKTVDALFTALNSKDKLRLSDCDQRLRTFRLAGTLPTSAANQLDAIIRRAESGQWEESARTLYSFILAQRRIR